MKPLRLLMLHLVCLTVNLTFLSHITQAEDTLKATEGMTHTSQGSRSIQFADDHLTVKIQDVSLREILQEIARRSGFTLVRYGSLDEPMTLQFHQLPLDEGLQRILRHRSFALEYAQQTPEERLSVVRRPKTLWIFPQGDEEYSIQNTIVGDTKVGSSGEDIATEISRLQAALSSEDAGDREEAVDALGENGRPEAVAPLRLALADQDEDVREAAIDALADIGGSAAAQALAIALRDENASIREEAVEALGAIGGAEAAQVLGIALQDNDASIREEAVEGLAKIGGVEATRALAIALQDEDSWVREEAVEAVGNIGGEEAVRLLELALEDDDESVRSAAAKMLVRVKKWVR